MNTPTFLSQAQALQPEMEALLMRWANINTYSTNYDGLQTMLDEVRHAFAPLEGCIRDVHFDSHEHGKSFAHGLEITQRPDAPRRAFLAIHADTVFPPTSSFQTCTKSDDGRIHGPGVCDAKGGLVVLLYALKLIEQTDCANDLGWEVFINTDEEIGSPHSRHYFETVARHHQIALLFEPALPNGNWVKSRPASGNFTIHCEGKNAHVGRTFAEGKNAVLPLANLALQLHSMNQQHPDWVVNVGRLHGGNALNVVPNRAELGVNVRVWTADDMKHAEEGIQAMLEDLRKQYDVKLTLSGGFTRPPKVADARTEQLFNHLQACAQELSQTIHWEPTGGCSDGNNLAHAGLPNLDTMGVRGGEIHTEHEFMWAESLSERVALTASFLAKVARGEIAA